MIDEVIARNLPESARQLAGDVLESVSYLIPVEENIAAFATSAVHVVNREVQIHLKIAGRLFVSWFEEPRISGHPIRIAFGAEPMFRVSPEVRWIDMSADLRWQQIIGKPINDVVVLWESAAEIGSTTSTRFPAGVELRVADTRVQVCVMQPTPATNSIEECPREWDVSTTISIVFPPCTTPLEVDRPDT